MGKSSSLKLHPLLLYKWLDFFNLSSDKKRKVVLLPLSFKNDFNILFER